MEIGEVFGDIDGGGDAEGSFRGAFDFFKGGLDLVKIADGEVGASKEEAGGEDKHGEDNC